MSTGRAAIITEANIQGAPDLVVEILSERTRKVDERVKRDLYSRYGVAEYWIIDPDLETIKVYRMTDKGYLRAAELAKETKDALSSPLLPGLSLLLAEIFG